MRQVAEAVARQFFRTSRIRPVLSRLPPGRVAGCRPCGSTSATGPVHLRGPGPRVAERAAACPASDDRQQLIAIASRPPRRRACSPSTDYWGTRVDAFGVREPHRPSRWSPRQRSRPARSRSRRRAARPRCATPRSETTLRVPGGHRTRRGATACAGGARAVVDSPATTSCRLVLALHRLVGMTLTYVPGSTYVGVEVEDVLASGSGVCQDYAHLAVALCRQHRRPGALRVGLPLHRRRLDRRRHRAELVHVQTHAWFEAAIPGFGWLALDPTNQQAVGPATSRSATAATTPTSPAAGRVRRRRRARRSPSRSRSAASGARLERAEPRSARARHAGTTTAAVAANKRGWPTQTHRLYGWGVLGEPRGGGLGVGGGAVRAPMRPGPRPNTTNQRMELAAVLEDAEEHLPDRLHVVSDFDVRGQLLPRPLVRGLPPAPLAQRREEDRRRVAARAVRNLGEADPLVPVCEGARELG